MGYLDFVDLLGEELGVREGRRFRNALKLSGLPHHKTLEEFDFTFQPELEPRKIRDLATLEFIERHANVALLGPPGSAKPTSRPRWPSRPAKPATRSTSPAWTTWSASSRSPRPPAGSTANSPATYDRPFSSSTYAEPATMPRCLLGTVDLTVFPAQCAGRRVWRERCRDDYDTDRWEFFQARAVG